MALIGTSGAQVVLVEGSPEIGSLGNTVKKAIKKALKTASSTFKNKKRAAIKAIKKFIKAIVT